ncbi:MAG: M13 family metallopeptidase [Arenimonas sp.]
MTLIFRPLMAALAGSISLVLFVGPADAKKMASAPPPPAACSDFYGYVNTPWLRSNPLPPGYASRSLWDEMNELTSRQRESLFSSPQNGAGPAQEKLNALMRSADESRIKLDSDKLLTPLFSDIEKIKKPKDISSVIASMHSRGIPLVFDFDDEGNKFSANAIGLPELAFYTEQDPAVTIAQGRYRAYVQNMLTVSGVSADKAGVQAGQVLGLEMQLAAVSGESPSQLISLKDAAKQYGNLQLGDYMRSQKAGGDKVTLMQPVFFKAVNDLINPKMIDQWKSYLRFHAVNQLAPYLNEPYFSSYGQFYEVYLEGRAAPKSRTQNLRELIEASAPELIDAAYAERYIGNGQRERARAITDAIMQAAEKAVIRSTWVVNQGEERDLRILKTLKIDIGRDTKNISSIDVNESLANSALKLLRRGQKIRNSQSADTWPGDLTDTAPLLVYMPADNRIIISNALLQAPVFDAQGNAVDYGAFGALFAQQLSLALYQSAFKNVTVLNAQRSSLIAQYNAYPLSGAKKVNGTLTSTQNLADLSGLEIAFQAYMASGTRDKTAQQDFFKSWANLWGRVDRDSALSASYDKANHAPAKWRVNGPLSNMASFGTAFACKAGPMQRPYKDQLRLWP